MNNNFGAYYKVDPTRPSVLRGKSYENAWYMGGGVSFFLIDKDERDDQPDGTHGMAFDVSALSADEMAAVPVVGRLLMGYPIDDLIPTLLPVVQYLLNQDIIEGLTGPEIIDRRIAILIPEFVGFWHRDIKKLPIYIETTDEESNVVGNISKCSEEK